MNIVILDYCSKDVDFIETNSISKLDEVEPYLESLNYCLDEISYMASESIQINKITDKNK